MPLVRRRRDSLCLALPRQQKWPLRILLTHVGLNSARQILTGGSVALSASQPV